MPALNEASRLAAIALEEICDKMDGDASGDLGQDLNAGLFVVVETALLREARHD